MLYKRPFSIVVVFYLTLAALVRLKNSGKLAVATSVKDCPTISEGKRKT